MQRHKVVNIGGRRCCQYTHWEINITERFWSMVRACAASWTVLAADGDGLGWYCWMVWLDRLGHEAVRVACSGQGVRILTKLRVVRIPRDIKAPGRGADSHASTRLVFSFMPLPNLLFPKQICPIFYCGALWRAFRLLVASSAIVFCSCHQYQLQGQPRDSLLVSTRIFGGKECISR